MGLSGGNTSSDHRTTCQQLHWWQRLQTPSNSPVIDRLTAHLRSPFLNLCPIALVDIEYTNSRLIDDSIAKHEFPNTRGTGMLPSLIKQVSRSKSNHHQLAALTVLMNSALSACYMGWVSTEDYGELIKLANEIAKSLETDLNTKPNRTSLSVMSTILSRFYPRMKINRDHIFSFLEAKSGYHIYVRDFQISKDLKYSPGDKIRLFVVQTDNIETSSCLVTPAKVEFFLNGMQVDGRNSSFMDSGPQLPTDITPLLKNGTNLLQASGVFRGNYIIAVAFMSELPNPDSASLQDYEHAPATVDADCEVIEELSGISLNCPISFGRIKTPVKGRSCKHIPCFDFDNFVEINSRRPHWRCPSCNKHVCFSDIRLDQNMVKLLKEADPSASAITLNSKSRDPATESEDTVETLADMPLNTAPPQHDVVDLTQDDDDDLLYGIPAPQPDHARIYKDVFGNVEPNGHTPDVSVSLLLTYPNKEVGVCDRRGSNGASTSRTLDVRWEPGRMRGPLSGQVYNDYYKQAISVPNQQAEAARARLGNLQRKMRLTQHQAGYLA